MVQGTQARNARVEEILINLRRKLARQEEAVDTTKAHIEAIDHQTPMDLKK